MPEYRCKNCGGHFFGWGSREICPECGGRLEPVNGIAKGREKGDKNV